MMSGQYPKIWRTGEIQREIRKLAKHKCEQCGMRFNDSNIAIAKTSKYRDGKSVIGHVHHIDGNKANCCQDNLVYLCQICHYLLHKNYWEPGRRLLKQWSEEYGYEIPKWIVDRDIEFKTNDRERATELMYIKDIGWYRAVYFENGRMSYICYGGISLAEEYVPLWAIDQGYVQLLGEQ